MVMLFPPNRRLHSRRVLEAVLVPLGFFLFTSLVLGPVWHHLDTHLAPDLGDPLFNLVLLQWDLHHISLAWGSGWQGWMEALVDSVWNLPIYHPTDHALLLSDHLLGTALLSAPIGALAGPLVVYNLLFFASFWLSALVTYGVLRASGLSPLAGVVGALVFAYSPLRWSQASHLQILLMQWIPLLLFSFDRLLAHPRGRWAALFLAAYALHLSGGAYLACLVHVPLAALALHRALSRDTTGRRGWRRWRDPRGGIWLATAAALALILLFANLGPYLAAPEDMSREGADLRAYGATLPSLLTPSARSLHFPVLASLLEPWLAAYPEGRWHDEKALFPGVVALILSIAGLVTFLRHYRPAPVPHPGGLGSAGAGPRRGLILGGAIFLLADVYTWAWPLSTDTPSWLQPDRFYDLAFAGVVLTVLPSLWILIRRRDRSAADRPPWPESALWPRGLLVAGATSLLLAFPLFFEPLGDHLPGLGSMRAPARSAVFASFAFAFFAAWGWDALLRRARRQPNPWRRQGWTTLVLLLPLLVAVESRPAPLDWQPLPEIPPAHHWIAAQPDIRALLELPFGERRDHELLYMHSATLHWTPLANGYSGYDTDSYRRLRQVCCWPVPEARALRLLRRFGVSHVLIHRNQLARSWARRSLDRWLDDIDAGRRGDLRVVYRDPRGDVVVALGRASDGSEDGRK